MALLTLIFTLGPLIGASLHIDVRNNTGDIAPCTDDDMNKKDFDVVVFGATGFVGQLAVEYLSKGHPDKPHWAIAGRNKDKLTELFYRFRTNPATSSGEMIVADTNGMSDMLLLARRTKTILSFAGPYEKNGGEEVIRAAINGCAHYVDLAGETPWKSYIMNKYHETARERGIAIVQSAGFYSMAADFLAVSAATDLSEQQNKLPAEVLMLWNKMNGHFTGGQKASIVESRMKHGKTLNPYILAPVQNQNEAQDIEMNGFSSVQGNGKTFGWDASLGMVLMPYSNSAMECAVMRRSMKHLFHTKMVHVLEAKNASVNSFHAEFWMNPERAMHPKYPSHPLPGQGPDKWLRELGSSQGTAFVYEAEQNYPSVMVSMEQNGDPATVASPRMAVEMAVALAQRGLRHGEVGYLTPATALPIQDLERRLSRIDDGNFMKIKHWNGQFSE